MCTASWLTDGERFHFLFNRDERLTRSRGLPPDKRQSADVVYLAPIDPDSGGTWFAATDRGLILALLNRTVDGQPPAVGRRSRGSLIPELVQARDLTQVATLLGRLALAECAPFRLFADLPASADALGAVWNGRDLATQAIAAHSGLLCSSSRGDQLVTDLRGELWRKRAAQRAAEGVAELRRFHRSHLPSRSAASVCMHREDAATVSHLELLREPEAVCVTYSDGSPCNPGGSGTFRLPLRASPGKR